MSEGMNLKEAERQLQDVERTIDHMVANMPDGADETLPLWRWSQRFANVMKEWQRAYTNVVLAEEGE